MEWRIEILNETVKAEIAALPMDIRAKLTHILDMMVALGPQKTPPQILELALQRAKELEP